MQVHARNSTPGLPPRPWGRWLSGGGANVVEACYIGGDPTGTLDRGDGLAGISIADGSSGNRVGALLSTTFHLD